MPSIPPEKNIPESLNDYLEIMSKSVFQAGMSWKVIENKWASTKEAFHDFDIHTVADFHEKDIEDLTKDTRVIRNFRKLSAIVYNAQKILDLDQEHGSFQKYLRSHDDFDATLKAIRKDFKFMGPTGIYMFLYIIGEEVIPHAKADMGLVLVPEGRQLFNNMSVDENLEMGASPKRARPFIDKNLELVYEMFPRLKERSKQKAGTLSGGEQQMLAVGRGLMAQPKVLMIDELSLGLAPVLVLDIFENLLKLKQTGITMLLVEQNVQMALAVSDYAYVLAQGRIDVKGPSQELAQNKDVQEAYLGI